MPSKLISGPPPRSCAGTLALVQKVGKERLENACERALAYDFVSLKLIRNILDRELDKVPIKSDISEDPSQTRIIPLHANIRGAGNYQ